MANDQVRDAQQAADDNLRRNSGRDQADYEAAVDAAERRAGKR